MVGSYEIPLNTGQYEVGHIRILKTLLFKKFNLLSMENITIAIQKLLIQYPLKIDINWHLSFFW